MLYLVITPRNLEDISIKELNKEKIKIVKKLYRKILIDFNNPNNLSSLRSPDDVLIFLREFNDKKHYIGKLQNIYEEIKKVDISNALNICNKVRTLKDLTFSVTASIIGKRKFSQDFLKRTIAKALKNKNIIFKNKGKPDLDFSIIIENENVFFGLRLFKEPLHKRYYKKHSLPASLKSNIAYSMLELGNVTKKDIVLDPMCGIGTIPIEATFIGAKAIGFDINSKAIQLAKKNAKKVNKEITFEQRDATDTKLLSNSIDKIVSNLPFGKQITLGSEKEFFKKFLKEASRILKNEGICVFLTTHYKLIRSLVNETNNLKLIHERDISLFGLNPHIIIIEK